MPQTYDVETGARMELALQMYRDSHDPDCTCTPCMDWSVIQHQLTRPVEDRYTYSR